MTTVFVSSFNHGSMDGIAEIVNLIEGEFRRLGFRTISCRTLPGEINDGDLLIIIDEFSEPLVVEALESFRKSRPRVTLVCVLTEFFSPGSWVRPPNLNSFKQPYQSLLFDNLLYVFCFLGRRSKLFTGLRLTPPGLISYLLSIAGLTWLALQKFCHPRTPVVRLQPFHERAYLWFRALGLQSVAGIFDFYLALHPDIRSAAMATALKTSDTAIHTFLLPPPLVEKSSLVNSKLEFGIDFSGSLSSYRKRKIRKIMKMLRRLSPSGRFAHHMERGFDDSKMALLLSYNPPQSRTWRYSSPMRIIGAIKRGQIPVVCEKFGDHPAEELALSFPENLDAAKSFVTTLAFEQYTYISSAWERLQKYRKIAEENNSNIIRELRESRSLSEIKNDDQRARRMTAMRAGHVDVKHKQMAVNEQAVVLSALAQSVASPNCRLLEVGTWCGDSAMVLGSVAKKYGGRLYCVDWWKGNVGTELHDIADSQDIYSLFWKRVRDQGLDDTIIPLRGKSEDVSGILLPEAFDLIYIDADHRFDNVMRDIQTFAPLVREGGILCGDDCEGWLADFEADFLERGKNQDFFESVHCGVVLAVASNFPAHSIDYNIWSVKKTAAGWVPTEMRFNGIAKKRQFPPPLLETRGTYNIVRYGRNVYAIPHSMGAVDITDEETRSTEHIISAPTVSAAQQMIDALILSNNRQEDTEGKRSVGGRPQLLGSILRYNIVRYQGAVYGLHQSLGPVDLTGQHIKPGTPGIKVAHSMFAVVRAILAEEAKRLNPRLRKSG